MGVAPLRETTPARGPDQRHYRPPAALLALCLTCVLAIAFVTLCPLAWRPRLASANLERFGAYLVLGGLFGLAAPRRLLATLGATTVLAFALEAAQGLAPGRDPALADALVKALGGAAGVGATCLFFKARRFLAHLAREDQPVFALAPLIDP